MGYMIPLGGSSSLLLLGRLAEKLWSVRGVNVVGMWMFRTHTVSSDEVLYVTCSRSLLELLTDIIINPRASFYNSAVPFIYAGGR